MEACIQGDIQEIQRQFHDTVLVGLTSGISPVDIARTLDGLVPDILDEEEEGERRFGIHPSDMGGCGSRSIIG